MSAIAEKLNALIASGAKLSELIDAALEDGFVLDLRMKPNAPGSSGHKLIVRDGDSVEVSKL